MITSSGAISHKDILDEVGLPTATNSLYQEIRTFNGIRQYKVNGVWRNCNMCSQHLPQDVAPYAIKDWYSYKHDTNSVTGVTITGDDTVDQAQTVTYTATLSGEITAGSVITWYKFDNGIWSSALGTGTTISITWTKPAYGIVRASVYSPCSGTTIIQNLPITWNCTPITAAWVWGQEADLQLGTEYTYVCTIDAGSANDALEFELVTYGVNFVITSLYKTYNTTTNKYDIYIKIIGYVAQLVGLNVKVKNFCMNTWYNVTSKDLYFVNPSTTDTNDARTATLCKQCLSGYTGSCKSVSRGAEIFTGATKAEANYLRDVDMQNEVNNDPLMYCQGDGGGNVPNQEQTGYFTKQCPEGYYGSEHPYTVPTDRYFAATVMEANTLALNDIQANGQNYVNNLPEATCTSSGGGGCITPQLSSFNFISFGGIGLSSRGVENGEYGTIAAIVSAGNNLSYSWVVTGGQLSTPITSTASSFNIEFYSTDINQIAFTIQLTISNGCGSVTKSYTFSVKTYWNEAQSGIFYKECVQGTANPYTYTIPSDMFKAFSQADANTQATAAVNSYGQTAANQNGTCNYTPPPQELFTDWVLHDWIYRDTGGTFVIIRNSHSFSITVYMELVLNTGGTKGFIKVLAPNTSFIKWYFSSGHIGVCGSQNYYRISKISNPSIFIEGFHTHQAC